MKNSWLFVGILYLSCIWISSKWLFIAFIVGMLVYYVRHFKIHPIFFLVVVCLVIVWTQQEQPKKPIQKIMQIKEIKANYVIASTGKERVIVYGIEKANFDDVIEVKGNYQLVDTIHNIDAFNFTKWLQRRKIYYQMNANHYKVLKEGKSARHSLYTHIQKKHGKEEKEWLLSMLFQIHKEDVSYFVSASGMHISFLAMFLEKQLRKKVSSKTSTFVSFVLLGVLGYCTLFSTSLIRILCFRLIALIADKYSVMDRVGLSIVLVLLLFPYMAFELAFLLPLGFRLLSVFNVQKRNSFTSTFALLIPIQFMFFHACNPFQILLFRFLRVGYGILYMISWVLVFLPIQEGFVFLNYIYQFFLQVASVGYTIHYTPNCFWLLWWGFAVMRYLSFAHQGIKTLCFLLVFTPFAPYLDPFGEIYMMDVGQGDCTLVRLPFHQGVMLIDVMGSLYKNIPEDIIVPVLQSKGIDRIDKVILTHEDYDHSGGWKELKKLIPVDEMIRVKQKETYLGDLRIPFLLSSYQGKDDNDNSIITFLEVYGIRALCMGDAGIESEQKLLKEYPNIKVDVLKAGHHGSATSSSLEFLHQIKPKIALISAGRNNQYHHPSEEIIKRMEAEDILPLVTSRNGGVSIKFCKYFAFFKTADNEFGIIDNR